MSQPADSFLEGAARGPLFLRLACAVFAWRLAVAAAHGQGILLDDFEQPERWEVIASEQVVARVSTAEGVDGRCLRLDYEFRTGAGFCVLRRVVQQELPENYRFTLQVRGQGPANNFEFKLVSAAGDDVWWVNLRDFEPPAEWQRQVYGRRRFRFAWGPSGGRPLERVGAIELAVAAGEGGRGTLWFDSLTFEELVPPRSSSQRPRVSVSSAEGPVTEELPADGTLYWRSAAQDARPWLALHLRGHRELGGVAIEWDAEDFARSYRIELSDEGESWQPAAAVAEGNGGRDYVPLPEVEAAWLRLHVDQASRGRGVGVRSLRIMPPEFGESRNQMLRTIAMESPTGRYPRYFLGLQQPWTVLGVPDDEAEALLDAAGAVEAYRLGPRIEPFVFAEGRLLSWADARIQTSLEENYLPIPSVEWALGGLGLRIAAVADGPAGASCVHVRYRLSNRRPAPVEAALLLAVRPFQVLPSWHELNLTGGAARVGRLAWQGGRVLANGRVVVAPWCVPEAFGASAFLSGEIVEYLAGGRLPAIAEVEDATQLASGALRYPCRLGPGESRDIVVSVPLHAGSTPPATPVQDVSGEFDRRLAAAADFWRAELNRVRLELPAAGARIADTFRTTQAYILINADGPAIQPGSRTYERSWIRDGVLTSTALLYTGRAERVRAFLDWYAPHQFESGKVPCVVDRRGPDPVPEHDSAGELIYALWKYHQFTGDTALLARHLPRVEAAVRYIEALRAERLTAEFRDGPPQRRACWGLVPESISHEGYSARPMHSYWDSFWVLRGLKDAVRIAEALGRSDLAQRWSVLRDEYRQCLYESMRLAMRTHGIDFVPGCVELGDFDATSTAIGVFPGGELGRAPEPELARTFERYYRFFCDRREGRIAWESYTPYEVRLIGTFVRLGQPGRAHELLEFFLRDQRPAGWNQWGEVVWRDADAPGFVGDMPHTWVGSDFLSSVRSLFVYEREADETLVLAGGVRAEWLEEGGVVRLTGFPTEYGTLDLELRREGPRLLATLGGRLAPPGGVRLCNPTGRAIEGVRIDGVESGRFDAGGAWLERIPAQVEIRLAER